ncbi:hypothetical protein [Motiliproteus sp. SC1-56]|uniref:hypothetical protein n=1 Tax=Motiliproteus sp. SC1-56 TaxID=2799565 RepID=UPI001A8EA20F|nr:hypothetical protein [Motiliproteus sp. SC1-56]
MKTSVERNERRLKIIWYVGLLALPVLILLLLSSMDPYERVKLNQVLELRQSLKERGAGAEVIDYLDRRGGRNISAEELESLREASGSEIFFMLRSARLSEPLRVFVGMALEDGYITRGEAEAYQDIARRELSRPEVLQQFGF